MDIRNWPMDKVMQLPDCCFGRRWPVCCTRTLLASQALFYISPIALPEWCVLWEAVLWTSATQLTANKTWAHCLLKLGDTLPAVFPDLDQMEYLFPNFGLFSAGHYSIRPPFQLRRLRFPIHAAGRRVVVEFVNDSAETFAVNLVLVFSSIPTEVPDWLISDQVKSR